MIMLNRRKNLAVIYPVAKSKPGKKNRLEGIRTHHLCDAGTILYQLSYQSNQLGAGHINKITTINILLGREVGKGLFSKGLMFRIW